MANNDVGNLVDRIIKELDTLRTKRDDSDEARKAVNKLRAKFREVESELPFAPTRTNIGKFFSMVSDGMVNAQKDLDRKSREYSDENPQFPSAFRIPKAQAELYFDMEAKSESDFNIIIYSEEDVEKAHYRHKVNFEIIAAPPPPGIKIDAAPGVVTNPRERQAIRRSLRKEQNESGFEITKIMMSDENFNNTVIIKGTRRFNGMVEPSWNLFLVSAGDAEEAKPTLYFECWTNTSPHLKDKMIDGFIVPTRWCDSGQCKAGSKKFFDFVVKDFLPHISVGPS